MDGPHGKDPGMEGGLEEQTELNGRDKGARQTNGVNKDRDGHRNIRKQVNYLKEATVVIDLRDNKEVKAEDIILAVSQKIDLGKLLAVRPKHGNEYELTFEGVDSVDVFLDGVEIKGELFDVRRLEVKEHMVSFLHLPAYVDDEQIEDKLKFWGVTPMMKIKRRLYPGTNITDGTRYVKVKFPKEVTSLPYSAKFETADGTQYFRVIHDGQEKLCRMCMQPGHIFRDCPDFKCFECCEQGHFAKDCKADKCPDCRKVFMRCDCESEHEEMYNEAEVSELENNMEIMCGDSDKEEESGVVEGNEDRKGDEQGKGGDKKMERGEEKEMEIEAIMEERIGGPVGDARKEKREDKNEREQVEECIEVNLEELRRGMKRGIMNKQNVEESREKGQRRRMNLRTNKEGVLLEEGGEGNET